jgi:phosphatidylinositol glycan anchor class Y biosynthesis protein
MTADRTMDISEVNRVSEENFRALGLRHFGRLQAPKGVRFYGQVITAVFAVLGALFLYTAILSKLLPDSGNVVVDFIKRDYYFCYLIPLSIIPTYMVVYLNWLAIRHFEQN